MRNKLAQKIAEACARSGIGRTLIYELTNTAAELGASIRISNPRICERGCRGHPGQTRKETTMQNPLAHTIAEACARSGIGRTAIYELINTGQLPARKRGRRTLILTEDLQRCLQSLPSIKVKSELTGTRENVS